MSALDQLNQKLSMVGGGWNKLRLIYDFRLKYM